MILASLRIALRALLAARLRSLLTALGILIGTAAVVLVVALGSGARERISAEISKMGQNTLFIFGRPAAKSGARTATAGLTETDADAIRSEVASVDGVTVWSNFQARVHSATDSHLTGVMGIDRDYFKVRGFSVQDGRAFSPSELRARKKVVIVGKTVQTELFGSEPAVGHWLRIGRHAYQIVGLLTEKGRSPFEDQDDRVLMPISTFGARVMPTRGSRVQLIMASAKTAAHTELAQRQIESLLRQRHRTLEGEPEDFVVRSQEAFREAQDKILNMVTSLLLAVAFVALFIGGVGVMNIMLVSVTERTFEIGIRMSVGARRSDILLQFLSESVMLTTLGGLLGIGLAVAASLALSSALGWPMTVSVPAVVVALGTSLAEGVVFGLLPAQAAARLDPVVALRKD